MSVVVSTSKFYKTLEKISLWFFYLFLSINLYRITFYFNYSIIIKILSVHMISARQISTSAIIYSVNIRLLFSFISDQRLEFFFFLNFFFSFKYFVMSSAIIRNEGACI